MFKKRTDWKEEVMNFHSLLPVFRISQGRFPLGGFGQKMPTDERGCEFANSEDEATVPPCAI